MKLGRRGLASPEVAKEGSGMTRFGVSGRAAARRPRSRATWRDAHAAEGTGGGRGGSWHRPHRLAGDPGVPEVAPCARQRWTPGSEQGCRARDPLPRREGSDRKGWAAPECGAPGPGRAEREGGKRAVGLPPGPRRPLRARTAPARAADRFWLRHRVPTFAQASQHVHAAVPA